MNDQALIILLAVPCAVVFILAARILWRKLTHKESENK